jgi:ParB family transcriptional regulator, chromosome partitioning protein
VRANGILQPILVRPLPGGGTGYEIVAGERRYRAALKVGLIKIPVVVRTLSDEDTLAIGLIENLIREDITPIEEARAFYRLMTEFGWTQEEMGKKVGKSRPAIANALRLLELPETIQKSLEKAEMSEGHARALLGDRKSRERADFQEHQGKVWQEIIAKRLSVRDVEKRMDEAPKDASVLPRANKLRDAQNALNAQNAMQPAEWVGLEDSLRGVFGTKVRLVGTPEKGKIEIEFFSAEELDGLITQLNPPVLVSTAPTDVSRETNTTPAKRVGRINGLLSQTIAR